MFYPFPDGGEDRQERREGGSVEVWILDTGYWVYRMRLLRDDECLLFYCDRLWSSDIDLVIYNVVQEVVGNVRAQEVVEFS